MKALFLHFLFLRSFQYSSLCIFHTVRSCRSQITGDVFSHNPLSNDISHL